LGLNATVKPRTKRPQPETLEKFEKKYRPVAEAAWLKIADQAPSPYRMQRALTNQETPPRTLTMQFLYFFGFVLLNQPAPPPDDTASTQQALDAPPPLAQSAHGSYSLEIEQQHGAVINVAGASATPVIGAFRSYCLSGACFLVPGGSWARALVGHEFVFPEGYSRPLNRWRERLRRPSGECRPAAAARRPSSPVFPLSDVGPTRVKVFAGAHTHSVAEGIAGSAEATGSGTVTRISVLAE
jgi:hypothetical protein